MAGNLDLILAGIAGGGSGNALAAFAPLGTTMPATADEDLDDAFTDPGWCSEDGITKTVAVQSTDVNGFGSSGPLRTLKTQKKLTIDIGFLETNGTTLEIYGELALGSISFDAEGRFAYTDGPIRNQRYAAVFDVVDGDNLLRYACPEVQVTNQASLSIKNSASILYGVTLTAYPGGDGVAIHNLGMLPDLAS